MSMSETEPLHEVQDFINRKKKRSGIWREMIRVTVSIAIGLLVIFLKDFSFNYRDVVAHITPSEKPIIWDTAPPRPFFRVSNATSSPECVCSLQCLSCVQNALDSTPDASALLPAVYRSALPDLLSLQCSHPEPSAFSASPSFDLYEGDLDALEASARPRIVFLYAPWDRASRLARQSVLALRRHLRESHMAHEISIHAVNCWYPSSICRKLIHIWQFPALVFSLHHAHRVAFTGPFTLPSLIHFVETTLRPIRRLTTDDEVVQFASLHDNAVISYFNFINNSEPLGFRQFYYAALRIGEIDSLHSFSAGIITSPSLAEKWTIKRSGDIIYFHSIFHTFEIIRSESWMPNASALIRIIHSKLRRPLLRRVSFDGHKSFALNNLVQSSSALFVLLVPPLETEGGGPSPQYPSHAPHSTRELLMRELLLDWYDCNGTTSPSPSVFTPRQDTDADADVDTDTNAERHSPSPSASEFSALLGEEPPPPPHMRVAKSLPRELLQVVAVMPDPRIASSARLAALKSASEAYRHRLRDRRQRAEQLCDVYQQWAQVHSRHSSVSTTCSSFGSQSRRHCWRGSCACAPGNATAVEAGLPLRWSSTNATGQPRDSACSCCLDALASGPLADLTFPLLHASLDSGSGAQTSTSSASASSSASSMPAWVDYRACAGTHLHSSSASASASMSSDKEEADAQVRLRRPSDPYLIHQRATRFRRLCRSTQAHSSTSTTAPTKQTQQHLVAEKGEEEEERADESSGNECDPVVESVRGAGCSLNRTLEFVVVDTSQVTLLQQFGIEPSALGRSVNSKPSALILDFQKEAYYVLEREFSKRHVAQFLRDFLDAKLSARWRSESSTRDESIRPRQHRKQQQQRPQPSSGAGEGALSSAARGPRSLAAPLATSTLTLGAITGAQFESLVLRPGRDVLLLYHAPTCGANRFLYPQLLHLQLLAASLLPRLLILTIDVTTNDLPYSWRPAEHIPLLVLYPAFRKELSVRYPSDNGFSVAQLLRFVLTHTDASRMNGTRSSFLSAARLVQRVIRERWCPFTLMSPDLPSAALSSPVASARAARCLRDHLSALEERLRALKRTKTAHVIGRQSRSLRALVGTLSRLLARALHLSSDANAASAAERSGASGVSVSVNCSDAACFRRLVLAASNRTLSGRALSSPTSTERRLERRLRAAKKLVRALETLEFSLTRTLLRLEQQVSLLGAIRSILLQSAAALHSAQPGSSNSSIALSQARLDHFILQHLWRWWTSNRQ